MSLKRWETRGCGDGAHAQIKYADEIATRLERRV